MGIGLGSNFTVTMFGELVKVMEVPKAPVAAELPDLRGRKSPGPRTLDDLCEEDELEGEQRPRGKVEKTRYHSCVPSPYIHFL